MRGPFDPAWRGQRMAEVPAVKTGSSRPPIASGRERSTAEARDRLQLREPSGASPDTPPGFGAKVTAITDEARKLIERYARRREPFFYDSA